MAWCAWCGAHGVVRIGVVRTMYGGRWWSSRAHVMQGSGVAGGDSGAVCAHQTHTQTNKNKNKNKKQELAPLYLWICDRIY